MQRWVALPHNSRLNFELERTSCIVHGAMIILDTTFAARSRLATFFALSVLVTFTQPSGKVSSPSPWSYYLQVYPGSDPSASEAALRPPLRSLYFALMMSFGGDFKTARAIPGVQAALDQINRDPTLLPGYQLHYTLIDSQVCEADHEIGLDSDYSTHNVI